MINDPTTISTLQKLGLTYYEAKAYLALMVTGVTKPSVIVEESGIPRTKIYGTLKKLEENNWITIEKGRPSIISPKYPKEIIEAKKSAFNSDIDSLSNELSMSYDNMMSNETPRVRILHCTDNIAQLTGEMLERAEKRIMFMGSLYSPNEIEIIQKPMLKAKQRGVSVRIITVPKIKLQNGEINIIKALSEMKDDIKIGHPYLIKCVMVDDREILLMLSQVKYELPDLDNMIAIWIPDRSFTSYMASVFDMDWTNL
jgi:HTH-type transcriptional regulator, sugar sensing transcriptional regulator